MCDRHGKMCKKPWFHGKFPALALNHKLRKIWKGSLFLPEEVFLQRCLDKCCYNLVWLITLATLRRCRNTNVTAPLHYNCLLYINWVPSFRLISTWDLQPLTKNLMRQFFHFMNNVETLQTSALCSTSFQSIAEIRTSLRQSLSFYILEDMHNNVHALFFDGFSLTEDNEWAMVIFLPSFCLL